MRNLARKRAPEHPYLAVHWQMETINPKLLCDCAHTLVDVLIRMLHDESLSMNITTIWFARLTRSLSKTALNINQR